MNTMRLKSLLCLCLVLATALFSGCREQGSDTTAPTVPSMPEPTMSTKPLDTDSGVVDLGVGLLMTKLGRYSGLYMEDGTDTVVQDIMMIVVKNTTGRDLQLARISVAYSGFTAEYELTNIPTGQTVVALEKNRHKTVDEDYTDISVRDVVYFEEPMSLLADKLTITGGNGYIDLKNVSGEDITGTIFVYYKNSVSDTLYGGITYRAKLDGKLGKDSTARINTRHFNKDTSTVVQVAIIPQ